MLLPLEQSIVSQIVGVCIVILVIGLLWKLWRREYQWVMTLFIAIVIISVFARLGLHH
jgi:uncharacterized membrane protein YkgB